MRLVCVSGELGMVVEFEEENKRTDFEQLRVHTNMANQQIKTMLEIGERGARRLTRGLDNCLGFAL